MFRFVRRISGVMALLLVVCAINVSFAFGLTYQQEIGVNFTFNQSLNLTISSNIYINNLAPGTASDSNVIDVSVLTNSAYGYTLTATVGNNTTYNTRNLVHTNSSLSNTFSSVAYAATPTITTNTNLADNTWAYSYSTDNGSTWANYNGLPLYSDTENFATLKETTGPVSTASGDDIKFKIAAKASETQASGEYNNVINFTLVAAPAPVSLFDAYTAAGKQQLYGYYKMQDMTSAICAAVEVEDDQLQVIDTRDNKVYWIAKLADGNCWMTQNLDLDLNSSVTLTHADTDLGWGSDTVTQSWTPINNTVVWNGSRFDGWSNSNNVPYSADPGNYYYTDTFRAASGINYLTSSNTDYFNIAPYSGNGTHGHVGNYYNWSAAIAMNDTSQFSSSTYSDINDNPQNSICPAGWRLPTVTNSSPLYNSDGSKNEFQRINYIYNGNSNITNSSVVLESSPLYFVRGGSFVNASPGPNNAGSYGYYWSSTVYNYSQTYGIHLSAASVNPITSGLNRNYARSLRCIAR